MCNTHSFSWLFEAWGNQEGMLFLILGLMKNLEGATVAHISRSILGLNRAAAVNAPNKLSPLDGAITRR